MTPHAHQITGAARAASYVRKGEFMTVSRLTAGLTKFAAAAAVTLGALALAAPVASASATAPRAPAKAHGVGWLRLCWRVRLSRR